MNILKTYSILNDVLGGSCNCDELDSELKASNCVNNYCGITVTKYDIILFGDSFNDESESDSLVSNHINNSDLHKFRIEDDSAVAKSDILSVNYKTELKSGISYTPVFHIHKSGLNAGLIEKTEYYKDFIDSNNKGDLILVVEESYVVDDSDPSLAHTAKPMTERTKTWKHVRKNTGEVESESNYQKTKTKKYNTRRKRHIESNKRRHNILEQLIDNVGTAGIVSGTFTNPDDAYEKLTALQELHSSAFGGWMNSGRGSLVSVIENDNSTAWLNDIVADNGSSQALVPWMIGLTFRSYIQDKLKGNIE